MSTNITLIGLSIALILATAYWYLSPLRESKAVGRHRITHDSPAEATLWLSAMRHDAPRNPLSPTEAHLAMQQHRECSTMRCDRKAAAFDVLTGTGAIKPRTR